MFELLVYATESDRMAAEASVSAALDAYDFEQTVSITTSANVLAIVLGDSAAAEGIRDFVGRISSMLADR